MAFNPEVEVKALRAQVERLERKIDLLEKTLRGAPDLAAIAKLETRLDAAEKAIAGKKDAKTAEQDASKSNAKLVAEIQALTKDQISKAVLESRFKVLESQVAAALSMAGKR